MENDERIDYENLIIATGVRRRRLGVPGETDFQGRGILESGTRDKDTVKGKDVVIVGGGDAAAENAVILSQVAKTVTLVHRRNELSARPEFRHEIDRRDNIQILFDTQVRRFVGDSDVTGVEVIESGRGEGLLPADAVLVRIGVQPNSELFRGTLEMDSHGYVLIDPSCATSASGVFAIGDVASPLAPTLSTAVGMGATAAKAVFRCHVAKPRI